LCLQSKWITSKFWQRTWQYREKKIFCKHAEIINRDKILELLVDKQLTTDGIVHLQAAGGEDGFCVYAAVPKLSQRVGKGWLSDEARG
jgi:hypothetical protein